MKFFIEEVEEKEMICAQCGHKGKKDRFSKGNWVLEIFLWTFFFVPGAFYTTWRAFNEFQACPVCKNKDMTPLKSDFGEKIAKEKDRINKPATRKELADMLLKIKL